MKRAWNLVRKDMKTVVRDRLLVYALLFPLVGVLILRLLMPGWAASPMHMVVTADTPAVVVEELREYGRVEVVADRERLERRVLAPDDAVGVLVNDRRGFTLVLEGNEHPETRELAPRVLERVAAGEKMAFQEVDLPGGGLPTLQILGAWVAMLTFSIGSMIMGMNIVEEKEEDTIAALAVTPLTTPEFLLARGAITYLLAVPLVFVSLWLLGVTAFNHAQLLVITLAGILVAVLLGFYIGAVSSNKLNSIGATKVIAMMLVLPPALALLLPQAWHAGLYWAPTYWSFVAVRDLLAAGLTWAETGRFTAAIVASTALLFALSYPFLRRRLQIKV